MANAAGLPPPLRHVVAAIWLAALAVLAIAAASFIPHEPPACHVGPQAMPWVQEQRAACPEARP